MNRKLVKGLKQTKKIVRELKKKKQNKNYLRDWKLYFANFSWKVFYFLVGM